jgi:hypothetical protein
VCFPPLNLSRKELQDRLDTLRDYPTYKVTKASRINLKEVGKAVQTPIVEAALAYGSRDGQEEVLKEFISSHSAQQKSQNANRFQ